MATAQTPAALGYRMPAEWAPHAATWLSWPHRRATWPGKFEPVPQIWQRLAETISRTEPVHILAGGEAVMRQAREMVGHLQSVTLHDVPTNDAWTRDHGPTFLAGPPGSRPAMVDWEYNAWGRKYPAFDDDNRVPERIARIIGGRRFVPGIVLEGGAIDANGRGTILTTRSCLLNPNRNPKLSQGEIERYVCEYLGATRVLWLDGQLVGDDTDGHVDQLARFVNETTVVAAVEQDPADENFKPLHENFRRLQAMTDQDGRALRVVPLPMPRPVVFQGRRLPAGYANFYICNGQVIVPQFRDRSDDVALRTLAELFPDRKVVGLDAVDLVLGLGAIHCVTQQQPA
ncbi:MAG: agmatine deiminase family protein [Planctomycetia bacterium]|nr:agmatine deiminase family protein [Planctomycetia bacterium]